LWARDAIDAVQFRRFALIGQYEQDFYFVNRRSHFMDNAAGLRPAKSPL
jgi:hypothetical protein